MPIGHSLAFRGTFIIFIYNYDVNSGTYITFKSNMLIGECLSLINNNATFHPFQKRAVAILFHTYRLESVMWGHRIGYDEGAYGSAMLLYRKVSE